MKLLGKQLGQMNARIHHQKKEESSADNKKGEKKMEATKTAYRVVITLILDTGRKVNARFIILTTDINKTLERANNDLRDNVSGETAENPWVTIQYKDLFYKEECEFFGCLNVQRKHVIGYNLEAFSVRPYIPAPVEAPSFSIPTQEN